MLKNLFTKLSGSSQDPVPSTEPIDGKITYQFQNGLVCYQEELSLGQDEQLVGILMNLELAGTDLENTKLKEIISRLLNDNLLYKMLQVVLISAEEKEIETEDLKSLKNSELEAVIKDFFSLNPTARDWFRTIGSGLTSGKTPSDTSSL
jgi:hypothetical protein